MEFLRADPDFGTQAEFIAVGEDSAGINIDRGGVYFFEESLRCTIIFGDNRVGVGVNRRFLCGQ